MRQSKREESFNTSTVQVMMHRVTTDPSVCLYQRCLMGNVVYGSVSYAMADVVC